MSKQTQSNETKTLNTPVSLCNEDVLFDLSKFDNKEHGISCDCYDCSIGEDGLVY